MMRRATAVMLLGVVGLIGCTQESRSPDAIRNDTANMTSAATRDAKAMALGVVDGLRRTGTININKASREKLETLPGITRERADAIVAHRPYQDDAELLRLRVLSKSEYDRIVDRISTR